MAPCRPNHACCRVDARATLANERHEGSGAKSIAQAAAREACDGGIHQELATGSTPSIGSRTARVRSSMPDVANAVLLQLHALACDLGNFLRTLARTDPIKVVTDETRRRS
jgi:hypothetical protein